MRCRACSIAWPAGLGVCVARSAVATGRGESGSESPSKEKYPLEERRGGANMDLFRNTPKVSTVDLVLHRAGDSGSPPPPPPPVEPVEPGLRSLLLLLLLSFNRELCAEAESPPPLSSRAVNAPSDRFGGLLDEQSGTVSLGSHHSAPPPTACSCRTTGPRTSTFSCPSFKAQLFHGGESRWRTEPDVPNNDPDGKFVHFIKRVHNPSR
ncbi:hypothetical protein F2P81_020467 [Scophthalmus maximus]|uniref:Uncharacterized protein n=1 Tax=Scophthalmus maximus TaxID=52904 RepID=A0A6A4RY43_SCOMX|nr:hypothetical protein F2P81_020467 [Scophthalmus maximus]